MNKVVKVFYDLFIHPEKTFKTLGSRRMAIFVLYVLPLIIFGSILASSLFYGYILFIFITIAVFVLLYSTAIGYFYYSTRQTRELRVASEEVLPEKLISYFKKQHPDATLPMMLSHDRKHWVAYGHIDKIRMARAMTYAEYHLMDPPPRFTKYFMDHADEIKHQYLMIEDPLLEMFRVTDNPPEESVYYPVTVFDKEDPK